MCLAQGPQRSDAGEARTRGPSVSSQALYHWATALPNDEKTDSVITAYTCIKSYLAKKICCKYIYEMNLILWKFMDTSGLLQSKWSSKVFTLALQKTQSIHDSITDQKLNLLLIFSFYYNYLKYRNYL